MSASSHPPEAMMSDWVREEAARQMAEHCPGGLVPSAPTLAESCLRAGLAQRAKAIRKLRVALVHSVIVLEALQLSVAWELSPEIKAAMTQAVLAARTTLARYPEDGGGTTP